MEDNRLLNHRIIFLSETIDSRTANQMISDLLVLDADDHKQRIDIYINSPGGSVSDGLAIIDAMQCIEAPISTICIGLAASMAAWILAAGTKGYRFISPHAEVMIHQMSSKIAGETSDIQVYANRMLHHQQLLVKMFSQFTNQKPNKIIKDMERDFFMSAAEAQDYGIVDSVLKPFVRRKESE